MHNSLNPSFLTQLRAMLKRNFLIKKRQKGRTFMEIFLPLYFLGILAIIKSSMISPDFPVKDTLQPGQNLYEYYKKHMNYTVAVVPDTVKTRYFVEELNNIRLTKWKHPIKFIFYNNTDDLMEDYWVDIFAFEMAVIFKTGDPLRGSLEYELRANPFDGESPPTNKLMSSSESCIVPLNETSKIPDIVLQTCPAYQYYHSGFVQLQTLIDFTKIQLDSGHNTNKNISLPSINLKLFPKSQALSQDNISHIIVTLCLVVALGQLITYLLILVVGEKENKIKEGMKMMGLRDSVYWLSWFITYSIFVLIISTVTIVILYRLQVFQHSNYFLIFLLILLFSLSIIMMAFMITPFFDRARIAGVVGNLAVNLLSLLYVVTLVVDNSSALVLLISFISSSGFAIAFNKALVMDLSGDGVTLSTMWSGPGFSFGGSLIMMAVDIMLYGFLAYYLDSVIPSEYGTKRSPWFLFSYNFWFSNKNKIQHSSGESAYFEVTSSLDIEPMPKEWKEKEAIEIINVCKTFQSCRKPEVKAIDGLNLKIYEGQITAILGHNGAGKTSLFNILTGLTSPTSGTIRVYGHDIRDANGTSNIHQMTGVCPQHDILFELLSTREHLEFFASIRGVPPSQLQTEVKTMLKDIDLEDNADVFSKFLSGGQKRKLSIGIAIIGDPKIIILDEPTAGVDLFSRRHLWSILQSRKHDKVILMTTHYMDEADILADRKAVISKGCLRCCGSSLFLKNKFGIGYRLTMVLGNTTQDTSSRIMNLVTKFVPKAEYSRRFGSELSFMLPHDSVDNFAPLFSTIEEEISTQSQSLNIISYGVSMTTLEEVFLRLQKNEEDDCEINDIIGIKAQEELTNASPLSRSNTNSYHTLHNQSEIIQDNNTTGKRCSEEEENIPMEINSQKISLEPIIISTAPNWKQILFMLVKIRALRLIRDFKLLYSILLFPLIFSSIGLIFITRQMAEPNVQPLILNEGTYSTAVYNSTVIAIHNETSHSVDKFVSHFNNKVQLDWYDGSLYSLLNKTSHVRTAAINIKQCCDISNLSFTVLYNDTQIHSLPIIINSINNAVYRMVQAESSSVEHSSITASTYPFQKVVHSGNFNLASFPLSFWLGMALVQAPASLAVDMVYDREIRAKNQLRVNGLSFMAYFGSYFITFTTIMLVICLSLLGLIFFLFKLPFIKQPASVLQFVIVITLYCPSSVIFSTCISYFFDKAESAHSILHNISTFMGLIPFIVIVFMDLVQIGNFGFIFHVLFSVTDPLYIPFAVFYFINQDNVICRTPLSCPGFNFYDHLTKEIVALMIGGFLQIPFYICILFILDFYQSGGKFGDIFCQIRKTEPKFVEESEERDDIIINEGNDVKAERQKVESFLSESFSADHPVIIVQNLRKEYQSLSEFCVKKNQEAKVALKSLSFAVESGEIFGLLGHNGAGKTTAIRIITAEEPPTKGKVQINGYNVTSGISNVFNFVGYCPQHDAQWKNITVREHLELYSYIRGISPDQIQRTVDSFLSGLQIQEHANKHSDQCSGGTKRKLSFAMAMVGNPNIVLLDEPSAGMDPYSKRFLWNTIVSSFQGKRGAILTTHSMDEADALCTRVGIMVKGELRCIGSTQHLKNLYGAGYTLEVKLHCSKDEDQTSLSRRQAALKVFIDDLFPDASVESDFIGRLIFSIPQRAVTSLSQCFAHLEQAKTEFDIEEYSFSQTTLEQVFLKFALYDGD